MDQRKSMFASMLVLQMWMSDYRLDRIRLKLVSMPLDLVSGTVLLFLLGSMMPMTVRMFSVSFQCLQNQLLLIVRHLLIPPIPLLKQSMMLTVAMSWLRIRKLFGLVEKVVDMALG